MGLFVAGQKVRVSALNALGNTDGITVTAPIESTTSASYVNMGAVSSFSFTKYLTATRLLISMDVMFFVTNADTSTRFGVFINGVDYDVVHMGGGNISANVNLAAAGSAFAAANLAAGTYTIQARWKRTAGTGSPSRSTNGWLSMFCTERA